MYNYNTCTDMQLVCTLNNCRGLIDLASTFTNMVDNDITVHESSHQLTTTAHLHMILHHSHSSVLHTVVNLTLIISLTGTGLED